MAPIRAGLAGACLRLGRIEDAQDHLEQAIGCYERAGDRHGEAIAHTHLGEVFERTHRWRDTLGQAERNGNVPRAWREGRPSLDLNDIGGAHAQLGEYEQALVRCTEAVELNDELGSRRGTGAALHSAGYAHQRLGQHTQAVDSYRRSLNIRKESGGRFMEAVVLTDLGEPCTPRQGQRRLARPGNKR